MGTVGSLPIGLLKEELSVKGMTAMTRRLTTGDVLSDFACSPSLQFPGVWMSISAGRLSRGRFLAACDVARCSDDGCTVFIVSLMTGNVLFQVRVAICIACGVLLFSQG